jgi:hypothetical protein
LRWQRKAQKERDSEVKEKQVQLLSLQQEDGPARLGELNQIHINDLLEEEDLKWGQLAKEHWLKDGDKNTKFFHTCVKQRKRHNQIEEILDEGRVMCSTEDEVKKAFTGYFQHLFTTSNPICIERCLEGLSPKVT